METIGYDLRQMQRTPLAESHVEALRAAGQIVTHPAGKFVALPGQAADRFIYIEDGEIEVVNPYTNERHLPFTLGPTQFMGEISFLSGGVWSMSLRTVRDTRVIDVPRDTMLTLMSRIPEMSDIIISVFSARRRRQLDERDSSLQLIGEDEDRDIRLHRRVCQPQPHPLPICWHWAAPKQRRSPRVVPSPPPSRR